jgi:hypothetical protein
MYKAGIVAHFEPLSHLLRGTEENQNNSRLEIRTPGRDSREYSDYEQECKP